MQNITVNFRYESTFMENSNLNQDITGCVLGVLFSIYVQMFVASLLHLTVNNLS